jgi:cyclic-di-AMP phosphodiesterase PgpH
MQNANPKRMKTPRVSRLELPPGLFEAAIDRLQQRDVLLRLGMCIAAAAVMWAVTGAGKRPFPYRIGDTPSRTIVVTHSFSQEDRAKTDQQREVARSQALVVYDNNEDVLTNLREELKNKVVGLTQPTVDEKLLAQWREFYIPPPDSKPAASNPEKATGPPDASGKASPTNQPATAPVTAPAASPTNAPTNSAKKTGAVIPLALVALVQDASSSPEQNDDARSAPADSANSATDESTGSKQDNGEPNAAADQSKQKNVVSDAPTASDAASTNDSAEKKEEDTSAPAMPPKGDEANSPPSLEQANETPKADTPKPNPPKVDPPEVKQPVTPTPEANTTETMPPADAPKPPQDKPKPPPPPKTAEEAALDQFRTALGDEAKRAEFKTVIDGIFAPLIKHGVMDTLPKEHDGNQVDLRVRDRHGDSSKFKISEVLVGDLLPDVERELSAKLPSRLVAQICYQWLQQKLTGANTLVINGELTKQSKENAAADIDPVMIVYQPGTALAPAGVPLTQITHGLLLQEYNAEQAEPNWYDRAMRSGAAAGMFIALFTLCGFYISFREPRLISNVAKFSLLLTMVTATVVLSCWVQSELRAEIIPLMLFGMTIAVAYQQELAMLLSAAVALVVVFLAGFGMTSFVTLTATVSVAILLLGRVRSRRKLIYVGLTAGIASALTSLGVNTLTGPAPTMPIVITALWCGLWGLVAAFLMTGLLPFIENLFGVQTDLSLIELGDVAHPLLQELVRRAPGTYNHSIMVASIAEAAAEAIGAHGLLVRVGAYFHDIGKMLKPGYFVENQGMAGNRHDDLVPAMSTLIIIAHVKDGADLARQHHLPQPIIDFIQQHHGTTLVEYFYGRASAEQKANDPDRPVDESSFRYPGPKPQTKEAAVLMLADAVESASRSLVEPAPARIESLVHDIAMKRLLDGQFNACGLTLQELHAIEESLIKSLIAVYHGRVKYPGQRTA